MANNITNELRAQLFGQQSDDPFFILVTLSHPQFIETQRFVNNIEDVVSNGITFTAFPMKFTLPEDDGESVREVTITFDNVGRVLIDEIRSITSPIDVKLEMILASNPDQVQISLEELKIKNISYNKSRVTAKLYMDDFLSTSMTSEKYTPLTFPGLF